ncbi:MAG: hypothetical protein ABI682_15270 [Acidobacteriota bacterium]
MERLDPRSGDAGFGWLKIDPSYGPLRKNPRFQKLLAGAERS